MLLEYLELSHKYSRVMYLMFKLLIGRRLIVNDKQNSRGMFYKLRVSQTQVGGVQKLLGTSDISRRGRNRP